MRALSPVTATLRGDDPIDAFAWARRTLAVAVVQPPVDKSSLPPFRIPEHPRAGHQPFHNFFASAHGAGI
jgi:hypothetical protein